MKINPIIIALTIATAGVSIPLANAETWLEDFYNQAGAGVNVTGPGVFESQSSNLITGGGLSVRIPPKNIQLYNFNPPSMKMGCGGIDLWAGSFGFINKAQFVAFARNIGQNALGFFFKLALKTMAPEIDSTITTLQDMAQKMNNNSLNACETTKRMFANAMPDTQEAGSFTERMESFSTAMGTIGDNVSAIATYAPDLKKTFEDLRNVRTTKPSAIKNSGGKDEIPVDDYNLVYRALTNSGTSVFTADDINLIMSLTGTVIIRTPKAGGAVSGETIVEDFIPPTVTNLTEFIGKQDVQSSFAMNVCDAVANCLAPTQDAAGVHRFNSFAKISNTKITAMRDAIADADAAGQNAAVINYLSQSSVPIYRLLAITTKLNQPALSDNVIAQYSDAVAIDMTSVFIKNLMKEVARVAKTYKASSSIDVARIGAFLTYLKDLNAEADELLSKKQLQLAQLSYDVTTIEHYNRIMLKGMSDQQLKAVAYNAN